MNYINYIKHQLESNSIKNHEAIQKILKDLEVEKQQLSIQKRWIKEGETLIGKLIAGDNTAFAKILDRNQQAEEKKFMQQKSEEEMHAALGYLVKMVQTDNPKAKKDLESFFSSKSAYNLKTFRYCYALKNQAAHYFTLWLRAGGNTNDTQAKDFLDSLENNWMHQDYVVALPEIMKLLNGKPAREIIISKLGRHIRSNPSSIKGIVSELTRTRQKYLIKQNLEAIAYGINVVKDSHAWNEIYSLLPEREKCKFLVISMEYICIPPESRDEWLRHKKKAQELYTYIVAELRKRPEVKVNTKETIMLWEIKPDTPIPLSSAAISTILQCAGNANMSATDINTTLTETILSSSIGLAGQYARLAESKSQIIKTMDQTNWSEEQSKEKAEVLYGVIIGKNHKNIKDLIPKTTTPQIRSQVYAEMVSKASNQNYLAIVTDRLRDCAKDIDKAELPIICSAIVNAAEACYKLPEALLKSCLLNSDPALVTNTAAFYTCFPLIETTTELGAYAMILKSYGEKQAVVAQLLHDICRRWAPLESEITKAKLKALIDLGGNINQLVESRSAEDYQQKTFKVPAFWRIIDQWKLLGTATPNFSLLDESNNITLVDYLNAGRTKYYDIDTIQYVIGHAPNKVSILLGLEAHSTETCDMLVSAVIRALTIQEIENPETLALIYNAEHLTPTRKQDIITKLVRAGADPTKKHKGENVFTTTNMTVSAEAKKMLADSYIRRVIKSIAKTTTSGNEIDLGF